MIFAAPEILESKRLTLRIVAKADLPALLQMNGDDITTQFLPYATWKTLEDAEAWLERMTKLQADGASLQFVMVEKSSGVAVGTCLLFRYDAESALAELGYVLGRAYWGRGYMREALECLIGHAFSSMGLRRLEAEIDPANRASIRLVESIGFVKEGLLRERWITKGALTDVAVYGLLKSEYRQRV